MYVQMNESITIELIDSSFVIFRISDRNVLRPQFLPTQYRLEGEIPIPVALNDLWIIIFIE